MTSAPRTGTVAATQPGWRFWVALGVWAAVVAGFLLGLQTFWRMVAIGLGHAWGDPAAPQEWLGVWWTLIGLVIGLGVAAVAAIIARRWVALVLALLIAAACGFLAVGLFSNVRSVVAPAPIEHVDPGPLPCQCYSGSFCDCPGG